MFAVAYNNWLGIWGAQLWQMASLTSNFWNVGATLDAQA